MKINEKRTRLRGALWPWVKDEDLWLRAKDAGFTTIPRAMPLIGRALDQLSGKGFPLAQTYLVLWCLVFDEAFVEVKDLRMISYEAGFTGKRGETTWKQRMRKLQDLGFIDIKPGVANDMQYVLILDPFQAIGKNFENQTNDVLYQAIVKKQLDVGGRVPAVSIIQTNKRKSKNEFVVVVEYEGEFAKPVDVVSKENFMNFFEDESPYAEVLSLAKNQNGSSFISKTKFKIQDNKAALLTFREWQGKKLLDQNQ